MWLFAISTILLLAADVLGKSCTNQEANVIARAFRALKYDKTHCPEEKWMEEMRNIDPSPSKIIIDIGFNKGYNFAYWLNLWTPHLQVSKQYWMNRIKEALPTISEYDLCGYCKDCKGLPVSTHVLADKSYDDEELTLIGLDINPTNLWLSQRIFQTIAPPTGTGHRYKMPRLYTYLAAATKADGNISVWNCTGSVNEVCKIIYYKSNREQMTVPAVTVDTFVRAISTGGSTGGSTGTARDVSPLFDVRIPHTARIDILLVDTEGHDAEVLLGALGTLRAGRVRVIVFEYHGLCP